MKLLLLAFIFTVSASTLQAQDSVSMRQAESDVKALPVLWHQLAAEYRALCYQAFNIASVRLNEAVRAKRGRQKLAIITDLDETILDNSYSEAHNILNGTGFSPAGWKDWTNRSAATGVPGAADFLNEAHRKGVSVFYISNRDTAEIVSTMVNLQKLGLPDADKAHMLFLAGTSSKEARRQLVMGQYKVVMLLGDNLGDFTAVFDKHTTEERRAEADKARAEWGKKFIVLPNSIYGEWENAIYDYRHGLTPAQKDKIRKDKLTAY